MKHLPFKIAALAGCLFFTACNNGDGTKDAVDSAKSVNKQVMPVDKESSDFAVNTADAGMMEVAAGKLAQEKTKDARVKGFADMMVADHSKAGDELKTIASTENITLPDSLSDDHKKKLDDLKSKSGKDFDKAYMDAMVDGHSKVADMFKKASTDCKDSSLKVFAGKYLPTIQMHLDSAKAISGKK